MEYLFHTLAFMDICNNVALTTRLLVLTSVYDMHYVYRYAANHILSNFSSHKFRENFEV